MASFPESDLALEGRAIQSARTQTIRVVSVAVVLIQSALLLGGRQEPSTVGYAVLGASVTLAVTGALWATPQPWWGILGMAGVTVVVSTVLEEQWRADTSTVLFLVGYFGVVSLSRRLALAWLALSVALLAGLTPTVVIPVRLAGGTFNARWLSVAQLAVSGVFLWWAWAREVESAAARDRVSADQESDRLAAVRAQERVSAWRHLAVRTHETVLNDIRYVLSNSELDRERLKAQLSARWSPSVPFAPSTSVEEIVRHVSIAEGVAVNIRGDELPLDSRRGSAFTSAFREVVRNAKRHAGASVVGVDTRSDRDGLLVEVRYAAERGSEGSAAGIGRSVVIEGSLEAVGGWARSSPGGAQFWIPHDDAVAAAEAGVGDVGRVVLSSVTVGNAVGGTTFPVVLVIGNPGVLAAVSLVALVLATGIGLVGTARRVLAPQWLVAATITASAAAWCAVTSTQECSWTDVAVVIATLSGFALCSALVWSAQRRWWLLGLVWVAVMVEASWSMPSGCSGTTGASFRAAALPVLFFVLITWSLRRSARATEQRLQRGRQQAAEAASASTALEASLTLQGAVGEATALLNLVAAGQALDDERRTRLRCFDAIIRSSVQADPNQCGGLALAAHRLAIEAAALGVPMRVLTLRDSGERAPVSPRLVEVLRTFVPESDTGEVTLQVLTGPGQDVLMLTLAGAAARRVQALGPLAIRDGMDELSFEADEPDLGVVFVRRSIVATLDDRSLA